MRAALQSRMSAKSCIFNLEIPTPSSWDWENISAKWIPKWMSLSEAAETLNVNAKACAWDANVLMQAYLALNYANVHVENNYTIKNSSSSYFEKLFLNFCTMDHNRKLFYLIFTEYGFYYLCSLLWHGFFDNYCVNCTKETRPRSNSSLHLVLNKISKKRPLLFLKI